MFEKASSIERVANRDSGSDTATALHASHVMIGAARDDSTSGQAGDALRALDWSELTARLNAARELRQLLHRDAQQPIGSSSASFGDAAARYFRDQSESERPVNLDALEARKSLRSIVLDMERDVGTGDARDDG